MKRILFIMVALTVTASSFSWAASIPKTLNYQGQHNIIRAAPETGVKFVGASDGGDGTPDNPYQNIEEAILKAASGTTLIFKPGSTNYFSASELILKRPMVLKGKEITIRY
ncbi:MAG: hypothetical protein NTW97_05940 [Candidatus Krumholzibacteria bacterium]|nr:hypothetical protein [Candidatus Krumholzibacteria bacterium]